MSGDEIGELLREAEEERDEARKAGRELLSNLMLLFNLVCAVPLRPDYRSEWEAVYPWLMEKLID